MRPTEIWFHINLLFWLIFAHTFIDSRSNLQGLAAINAKARVREDPGLSLRALWLCAVPCFWPAHAPRPKAFVGLSQSILARDAREIFSLPLIAPTVLSGNLSMASLCG